MRTSYSWDSDSWSKPDNRKVVTAKDYVPTSDMSFPCPTKKPRLHLVRRGKEVTMTRLPKTEKALSRYFNAFSSSPSYDAKSFVDLIISNRIPNVVQGPSRPGTAASIHKK